ncbi:MAG: glycosyltransferase family 2 protein [Atribacterota bacterium]|nr:glycosyltransferase family 2 protein [Atribacterota bacterium]
MSISVIIPAYNEEITIGDRIKTVKKVPEINSIIVVSDGSTDKTALIAGSFEVEVCNLKENIGKGAAIKKGFEKTNSDILLFLDADLIGLTEDHIYSLIKPIQKNEVDMTIGVFSKGRFLTDLPQILTPYLSGQRGVKREIINNLPDLDILNYGLEMAITKVVKKNNYQVQIVKLHNLTQRIKEEKYGLVEGTKKRIKMYLDIIKQLKSD